MRPWRCTVAASAITQLRISCTSTWGASGAGSWVPDLRIRITLGQRRRQAGVVSVNVVAEMDFTFLVGERCPVDNEDRDALHQVYRDIVFSALHSLLHLFGGPSRIIAQCPGRQFGGLFDTNAAVAEITTGAREQIRRGCAVKIDIMFVRENQLDQSQRICGAWLLPHG